MLLLFFSLGLIAGSFLNVCIYRIPRGESVLLPPSHCDGCGLRIALRDLIPLFSYLWLKGRCRFCGGSISPLYPSVELLTGLLFAASYAHFGLSALLVKFLFLICILIVVSFIDIEHYLIPNRVNAFALFTGIVLNIYARDLSFASAVTGMAAAALFLLLPALASSGGMGGGDVKMAAVVGLFLGWPLGLAAVIIGTVIAGLSGLFLMLASIKGRRDMIPFGPFIACGTLVTIFKGSCILEWYTRAAGPG